MSEKTRPPLPDRPYPLDIKKARLLLLSATEALRQARYEQARGILSAFREGDPLYAMHLHLQGMIVNAQGRPLEALALFRRLLNEDEYGHAIIPSLLQAAADANVRDEELYSACFRVLINAPETTALRMLEPVLNAASFNKKSPFEWNTLIYRTIALPLLLWCIEHDHLDHALALEGHIYNYVRQRETESHFRECFMAWTDAMYAAGRRHDQGRSQPYKNGKTIHVGFFIARLVALSHVQSVLEMLQGFRKTGDKSLAPVVYCFSGRNEDLMKKFGEIDVPVVFLKQEYPETANKRFARLQRFSERLAEDKIDALVWASPAPMMALAFGMRIAPVQIWLSVKYHSIECPGIDRYMTRMSFAKTRRINGRVWKNIPPALDDWPTGSAYQSAARPIRDAFSGKLILGTFGREEKLTDPRFLTAITRILAENPGTVFLYTGRRNHPLIVDAFSTNGAFRNRVHYIGWVDTRLYANVVDIFLDSFPFPCGMTLYEAMSVGVPVVMRETVESRETGFPGHILPVIEGTEGNDEERVRVGEIFGGNTLPFLLIAHSDDEYVAMASRLIANPTVRSQVGSASRQFIKIFMTGTERGGQVFAEHVRNAVAEKRAFMERNQ